MREAGPGPAALVLVLVLVLLLLLVVVVVLLVRALRPCPHFKQPHPPLCHLSRKCLLIWATCH